MLTIKYSLFMRNYMLNAAMLLTFLFASCTESTILVEPTAEHSA